MHRNPPTHIKMKAVRAKMPVRKERYVLADGAGEHAKGEKNEGKAGCKEAGKRGRRNAGAKALRARPRCPSFYSRPAPSPDSRLTIAWP